MWRTELRAIRQTTPPRAAQRGDGSATQMHVCMRACSPSPTDYTDCLDSAGTRAVGPMQWSLRLAVHLLD